MGVEKKDRLWRPERGLGWKAWTLAFWAVKPIFLAAARCDVREERRKNDFVSNNSAEKHPKTCNEVTYGGTDLDGTTNDRASSFGDEHDGRVNECRQSKKCEHEMA